MPSNTWRSSWTEACACTCQSRRAQVSLICASATAMSSFAFCSAGACCTASCSSSGSVIAARVARPRQQIVERRRLVARHCRCRFRRRHEFPPPLPTPGRRAASNRVREPAACRVADGTSRKPCARCDRRDMCDAFDATRPARFATGRRVSVHDQRMATATPYVLLPRRAAAAASDVHRQDRARLLAGAGPGVAVGRDRARHRDQPGHRRRAQGDARAAGGAGRRARLRPARDPRSRSRARCCQAGAAILDYLGVEEQRAAQADGAHEPDHPRRRGVPDADHQPQLAGHDGAARPVAVHLRDASRPATPCSPPTRPRRPRTCTWSTSRRTARSAGSTCRDRRRRSMRRRRRRPRRSMGVTGKEPEKFVDK